MMKINKRKCREYANPDCKKLQPSSGLLHAKVIDYIITTDIKIIAHHRTLILYIYPRIQACTGDCKPVWTMFHTKDDFLTLARKPDGSTIWRTASFDRLDDYSKKQYAFYSAQDEKRVKRYFKTDTDGLQALISVQSVILSRRCHERQIVREKAIISRMAGIPALPRRLESWIKSIMPAYFFYDYRRGNKNVSGICSACGQEVTFPGIKQYNKVICPYCRHDELIARPRSRRSSNMQDRDTFQIIQKMGDGRLVIRIIKAYFSYTSDTPKIEIYENARQFVWQNADGKFCTESYYYSNNGFLTRWKKGVRPSAYMYQYFEGDSCGHLYTKNLLEVLRHTPFQYCPIAEFYHHFQDRMQVLPFLQAHLEHLRLEHLCKVGFYNIVSNLAYRDYVGVLDETQNRTHRILKVAAEDVDFLREIEIDCLTLKTYQAYAGIKERDRLLLWQLKHNVQRDILSILSYMTVHKFLIYMEKQYSFLQFRRTPHGAKRYNSMQDLVSEYWDYLEVCNKLNYNLKNNTILYPADLQKAHDRVAHRLKHKADSKMKREFMAIYKGMSEQLCFKNSKYQIICPSTPDDIIAEGQSLRHCVGSYIDRILRHECLILFLRKCCEKENPYYTIEIRGGEVVQVRGVGNNAMTPEVQDFINYWEKQVLSKQDMVA